MDLDYKYGDIVHSHRHRHATPDSHLQVVEHSLKDWCNSHFENHKDIDNKENSPCKELNEIENHSIDDGQYDNLKTSELYNLILELDKLSGKYYCSEISKTIEFKFQNGKVTIDKADPTDKADPNPTPIVIKNEKGSISIKFNIIKFSEFKITEKGIFMDFGENVFVKEDGNYDSSIIIRLKEIFRNEDQNKLDEEIILEKIKEEKEENHNKKLEKDTLELLGIERKMKNLERKDQGKQKELITLIILFIIGVMFGIYCIYTQFTLELN